VWQTKELSSAEMAEAAGSPIEIHVEQARASDRETPPLIIHLACSAIYSY
jgi:hypothetical protein